MLLGVSRNTVLAAYEELVAGGVVLGRRGARTSVASTSSRGLHAIDPRRMLREAQFPSRTVTLAIGTARVLHQLLTSAG